MSASSTAALPEGPPTLSLDDAPIPESAHSVLDLGCGDGQSTLRAISVSAAFEAVSRFVCGVDIDMDSLRALKARSPHLQCVRARGEQLPFKAASFDYVMSGVALPYMDIPRALREIRRVLTPGCEVWASLHRPCVVWHHLLSSIRTLNGKDILYRTYVLANAFGLHLTGRLFRFPLNRKRIESAQTPRGIRLALRLAGFTDTVMKQRGERFVVAARRG